MSNLGCDVIYIKEEVIDNVQLPGELNIDVVKDEICAENEVNIDSKVGTPASTEQVPPSSGRIVDLPKAKLALDKLSVEEVFHNNEACLKVSEINTSPHLSKNSNVANNCSLSSQHAVKKRYKCTDCGYANDKESEIKLPINDGNMKKKNLKTEPTVNNSSDLKPHIYRNHKKIEPFLCKECDYVAGRLYHLNKHVEVVHRKLREFKCDECRYTTGIPTNMKKHVNAVHRQLKAFTCEECSYASSRLLRLKHHIKVHHRKLKPFKCNECVHEAGTQYDLKKHVEVVHRKLKPFKCDECGYSASTMFKLKFHIKVTHRKLKSFKCKECDYLAGRLPDLKRHVNRVHRMLKTFKCDVCDYATSERYQLNKHVKGVHKTALCEGSIVTNEDSSRAD